MIDQQGNIVLNRAADMFVAFVKKDETGAVEDISSSNLRFVAANSFTLVPEPNPFNPTGRRLHFTPDHAADLVKPAAFVLQCINDDGTEEVIWSGNVSATGFAVKS